MDYGGELNPLASPSDNKKFLRFLHMSGKKPLKFQVFNHVLVASINLNGSCLYTHNLFIPQS